MFKTLLVYFFFFMLYVQSANHLKSSSPFLAQRKGPTLTPCSGKRVQRRNYKKKLNGCGPEGSTMMTLALKIFAPHFQGCCDVHDICYETCNINGRGRCDDDFLRCMENVCDDKYGGFWDFIQRGACKVQASAMGNGVKLGGEDAFIASQNRCCDCQ